MTVRDPAFVRFAKQVGVVAGALLSVAAVAGLMLNVAMAGQRARDSAQDAAIKRLMCIVELSCVVQVEPQGSPDAQKALAQLRAMRRFTDTNTAPTKEDQR